METLLPNDFLRELDMERLDSYLDRDELYTMHCNDQNKSGKDLDFLDDFLNLAENKPDVGIHVDPFDASKVNCLKIVFQDSII